MKYDLGYKIFPTKIKVKTFNTTETLIAYALRGGTTTKLPTLNAEWTTKTKRTATPGRVTTHKVYQG